MKMRLRSKPRSLSELAFGGAERMFSVSVVIATPMTEIRGF